MAKSRQCHSFPGISLLWDQNQVRLFDSFLIWQTEHIIVSCFSTGPSSGTKRDGVQAGVSGATSLGKPKSKVLRPSPPSSASSTTSMSMPTFQDSNWEALAIDCDVAELKNQVEEAEAQENSDRVEGLLLGAVKNLKRKIFFDLCWVICLLELEIFDFSRTV